MKDQSLAAMVREFEEHYISKSLMLNEGNITNAAKDLGIKRTTLVEKMKRYELLVPNRKRWGHPTPKPQPSIYDKYTAS